MIKTLILSVSGLICGVFIGFLAFTALPQYLLNYSRVRSPLSTSTEVLGLNEKKQVIGFLPYWLLEAARDDYSDQITTLTYFGLTIQGDGTIMKETNPGESEPGWYTLNSGKADDELSTAKKKGLELSLLIFAADEEDITELISDPVVHAKTMMKEVLPIMDEYDFTDLNIDIESVKAATPHEQRNFGIFIQEVRKQLDKNNSGTLTIEASPTVLIKPYLIDIHEIISYADYIVFMTYDYHYPGSYVTGPVSPLFGGGTISEFDINKAMERAILVVPKEKIILGMPLYGYEWETLHEFPRAAVIPGTGITASSKRVEKLLADCDSCKVNREKEADEPYLIYKDPKTETFHQIYYPDKKATASRLEYVQNQELAGVALWALGYESSDVMDPLNDFID